MIHSTSTNTPSTGAVTPSSLRPQAASATSINDQDTLSTDNTSALREALAASPEIRSDVVARGRELANDPSYPPLAIIEGLSRLFIASRDPSILE